MTSEKIREDLAQLTPEQLAELQAAVGEESQKRTKWSRIVSMGDTEFQVFAAEECAAGDAALRQAEIVKRLKNGSG